MRISFHQFNSRKFSFRKDPLLILENFWTTEEMVYFQEAMNRSNWLALSDMPDVAQAFPNSGNWLRSVIGPVEAQTFLGKVALPCIAEYIESFPRIKQRHVNFNYYSYAAGDCLPTHDDTDNAYTAHLNPPQRRLAVATYFHSSWHSDWGGELILYNARTAQDGQRILEVSQCISPAPGSIAIFCVPRFHRVCRVDPLAGDHKRLSIAGWFMTEHFD